MKTMSAMTPYIHAGIGNSVWCVASAIRIVANDMCTPFGSLRASARKPVYRLTTHLAGTPDGPLGAGQFRYAHRSPRMQFLRRDANLGPEPELAAVGEPRGRVDHDDSR